MTLWKLYELAPVDERVLVEMGFSVGGYAFVFEEGTRNEYRIVSPAGEEIGRVIYYQGRKHSLYKMVDLEQWN